MRPVRGLAAAKIGEARFGASEMVRGETAEIAVGESVRRDTSGAGPGSPDGVASARSFRLRETV